MPVDISTVLSICGDHRHIVAAIGQFERCPDHASVNLSEPGACEVTAVREERGIGIEAGLASCDDAARLIALSHPPKLHRILIEIDLMDFDSARIETEAILWLGAQGTKRGSVSRTASALPDGTIAPDNAAPVATARAVVAGKARG